MTEDSRFQALLDEGLAQSLVGWDFSWLGARTNEEPLPWDYRARALDLIAGAPSLLDLGTGGGEFLASLQPLPPLTWATEGYPPNVDLARARLEPLGVQVADVSQADGKLPFAAGQFTRILNRQDNLRAAEAARVLCAGGVYLSQQVGGENCQDFNRFLEAPDQKPAGPSNLWEKNTLDDGVGALESAGLRIVDAREAFPAWSFTDIAGVVFYLQAISWQIQGFTVEKYRRRLFDLHQVIEKEGAFVVRQHRWMIEAVKD